jgi:hypothetical protein
MKWYRHETRSKGLSKTIPAGNGAWREEERQKERLRKRWEDNIQEWKGRRLGDTIRVSEEREMERAGCEVFSGAPTII